MNLVPFFPIENPSVLLLLRESDMNRSQYIAAASDSSAIMSCSSGIPA